LQAINQVPADVPSMNDRTENADVADPVTSLENIEPAIEHANIVKPESRKAAKQKQKRPPPTVVRVVHVDIIGGEFWTSRPELLE
jgi:hypothetical protein